MTGLPLVNDLEQLLPKYIPKTIDFKEANMCFSLKDFKEGEKKKQSTTREAAARCP